MLEYIEHFPNDAPDGDDYMRGLDYA